MEKIKDVYSRIISKENLYRSAHAAARGRRYRDSVAEFNFRLEEELDNLHRELSMKTYRHGKYRVFTIYEPKVREIAAAPFRDRVVHHAVHDVIEPLIDRSFIYDSYACRKGKGTHKAVDRAQSFLRANKFCFHGDVKKYFPSIDHGILKSLVRARIGDKDVLWLLEEIVDSSSVVSGEWRVASERRKSDAKGEELQGAYNLEKKYRIGENRLQTNGRISAKGNVRINKSDEEGCGFSTVEYSRGAGEKAYEGVRSVSSPSVRVAGGTGYANGGSGRTQLCWFQEERRNNHSDRRDSKDDIRTSSKPRFSPLVTSHSPLNKQAPRGLPIGNLTSQFFANLYLNELDYFVKFDLRCRYYIRYMDDFLVFGNDRNELKEIKNRIRRFLRDRLRLELHEGKSQIFKTKHGIKFLGFRIYRNYRKLATENVKRFRKRLKRFEHLLRCGKIDIGKVHDSIRCWLAHAKYADTAGLVRQLASWREGKRQTVRASKWPTGEPANQKRGELR